MGIHHYAAFVLAGILLNLTPGTDTIYIVSRSIAHGRKAGIFSALGIASGCLVHICFAAFGLSVILSQSATIFSIVKISGAVYLFYLGIKAILSKQGTFQIEKGNSENISLIKIYRQGIFTNVLNPKVALFFLSFLPQFIDAQAAQGPLPFLILGFTFLTTGTIWCVTLAFVAAGITSFLRNNPETQKWLNRSTGLIFIYLGIKIAFQKR